MSRLNSLVATIAIVGAACGGATNTPADVGGQPGTLTASGPATLGPESAIAIEPVGREELATLVRSSNEFAAALYQVLADNDNANIALGPWSISEGLALPFAGARGDTAAQMADVLNYDLPGDLQHAAFHTLRGELRSRQNDGLSITTANRLFGQEGFSFLNQFLATMSGYYEAPLAVVDFGEPEVARETINGWTADQTNHLITELFPPGAITANTVLALVNAIHLDADWRLPFNPDNTKVESFTTSDGLEIDVQMMNFNESLPIARVGGNTAVQLPYSGGEMSMIVVLPDGSLDDLESAMSAEFFASINSELAESGIHLYLPKFEIRYHTDLITPLAELGLSEPFGGSADFSGMTGGSGLFIGSIEHEAFVQIDETGTEAAAATGTAMAFSHGPTVSFDRPFLFYVQDDVTGTILFLGRVTNPAIIG